MLATDANRSRAESDARLMATLSKLANVKGAVSDALTESAKLFKAGQTRVAVSQFVDAVRTAVERTARDGGEPRLTGDELGSATPSAPARSAAAGGDVPASAGASPSGGPARLAQVEHLTATVRDGPTVETGRFGPVFLEFAGRPQGAVARLMQEQSGEVPGALYHPSVGAIDLVWGEAGSGRSDGWGLAKIARYHPEVLDDLQGPLAEMVVTKRGPNRVRLESGSHVAVISREFKGDPKVWLLTEYRKRGVETQASPGRTTDIPGSGAGGMANSPAVGAAGSGRTMDMSKDTVGGMTSSPAAGLVDDNMVPVTAPLKPGMDADGPAGLFDTGGSTLVVKDTSQVLAEHAAEREFVDAIRICQV